jgi:hypothetical protein
MKTMEERTFTDPGPDIEDILLPYFEGQDMEESFYRGRHDLRFLSSVSVGY